jgi:DNA replication and repair protein RecF
VIKEGGEERRKFFDNVISQVNAGYLDQLITYNKYLKARNQLLKQFYENNYRDMLLLETYSEPLVKAGIFVHEQRKLFLEQFKPILQKIYDEISSAKEQIDIIYESQLNEVGFQELNTKSTPDDLRAQRTTIGIHLDDFSFLINGQNLKKFGSQGQQKTFLLALKIAQHQIITDMLGKKPIMLLDDIFDKLDDKRIAQLLKMCKSGYFGQVFITDARKDRTAELLKHAQIDAKIFEVKEGQVAEEKMNSEL